MSRTASNDATKFFINVILVEEYTNNSDVEWCQVYRDFGENYCIPTDMEENIFIYQNAIRMAPDEWDDVYADIRAAFSPADQDDTLLCIYDFNGDGNAENREFKSGYKYVRESLADASTKSIILPLKWMPGLYLSSQLHV